MRDAHDLGDPGDPPALRPRRQFREDQGRGPRVGEGRRAHLNRSAPASSSSAASDRCATPPTPTMGSSGSAARTSNTARTATGWMAGPDSPPPPCPSTGRPVSGSSTMPEQGVDERDRLGAAVAGRGRHLRELGGGGAELGPARPPATRGRLHHRPGRRGRVGEHVAAGPPGWGRRGSPRPPPPRSAHRRAGRLPRRTPRRSGPRCWPRPGPRSAAARADRPAARPPTPGPCRPTALSMPARVGCRRGAGFPAHGKGASDFTTTAPSPPRSR